MASSVSSAPRSPDESLVVLDLNAVSFIDSTGLQLLIRLKRSVERGNGRIVLSRPSSELRRALRVAGLEGFFAIATD
jgi:anti-sigma B factor antagonist